MRDTRLRFTAPPAIHRDAGRSTSDLRSHAHGERVRVLLRLASEICLLALTLGLTALLLAAHAWLHAIAVLTLGLGVAAAALRTMHERGALALAWHCPRLDRRIRVDTRELPWPVLVRAERLLTLLAGEARRYATFLPDADAQVLAAVERGLELHRRLRPLLADPLTREGHATAALSAELGSLAEALDEIVSQLTLAATPAVAPIAPPELLGGLHARTHALAQAVAETDGGLS